MYAVDPLQRLRLLRRRLPQLSSENAFHQEMVDTFTSLRDWHTKYTLPSYFAKMNAYLPFRVEDYIREWQAEVHRMKLADGFSHDGFVAGVEILHWNGIPIARAVELAAGYHAGGNPDARHARGVDGLTKRDLRVTLPPDEEWVTVSYLAKRGRKKSLKEARIEWVVGPLPKVLDTRPGPETEAAMALGLDIESDTLQRVNKMLFWPGVVGQKAFIAKEWPAEQRKDRAAYEVPAKVARAAAEAKVAGLTTAMPEGLLAKKVSVGGRDYAYLRIFTFVVPDFDHEAFVNDVVRLLELPADEMPKNGLIIDVRGNSGGVIPAAERLLQLFTDRKIEPSRFQFINSSSNLELCERVDRLKDWQPSLRRALETGATYSAAYPITSPEACNDIGRRYPGPVILITDARCYSATDIFAAGFQDNGVGEILGVDASTGAGGANVWLLETIQRAFEGAGLRAPLASLAEEAGLDVAIRRALRVGPEAGTELEDFGKGPTTNMISPTMTLSTTTST